VLDSHRNRHSCILSQAGGDSQIIIQFDTDRRCSIVNHVLYPCSSLPSTVEAIHQSTRIEV
jgi:hypothetical protein